MKKLLFVMFAFVILVPMLLLAQDVPPPSDIPVPGSIVDIFADLKGWFGSSVGVAGVTIFLTLLVVKVWTTITAFWKQVVALVIALALITAGNIANFGFMAEFNVWSTLAYGLLVGFSANGLYDLKNIAKSP